MPVLLAFGVALFAPLTARAESIAVSAGVTLNFLDGEHDTGAQVVRLNLIPLPLATIDAGYARTVVHLEGIPPLTFRYGDRASGTQSTQLSVMNIVLRQALGGGFFVGIGQTIYNQRTTYAPAAFVQGQASRVTGARLETGFAHQPAGRTGLQFAFAYNPAMIGLEYSALRYSRIQVANPEHAVQLDTSLQAVTPLAHGDIVYGVRYLNYASRYVERGRSFDGTLADRNAGIMPLVGYRVRM